MLPLVFGDLINRHNVRMPQPFPQFRFPPEFIDRLPVFAVPGPQHLHPHHPPAPHIARPVDPRVTPRGVAVQQPVWPQHQVPRLPLPHLLGLQRRQQSPFFQGCDHRLDVRPGRH